MEYRQDGVARTRVVMSWGRGADEPWYLITNHTWKVWRIAAVYQKRIQEEESFRDMKSPRYGFGLRYVKLHKRERYERLMTIWALGMWIFFAQGVAASFFGFDVGLSTATNKRRDLSYVRIGVLRISLNIAAFPRLLEILFLSLL